MSEGVKFIRVRGRVVPIKEKGGAPGRRDKTQRALSAGKKASDNYLKNKGTKRSKLARVAGGVGQGLFAGGAFAAVGAGLLGAAGSLLGNKGLKAGAALGAGLGAAAGVAVGKSSYNQKKKYSREEMDEASSRFDKAFKKAHKKKSSGSSV